MLRWVPLSCHRLPSSVLAWRQFFSSVDNPGTHFYEMSTEESHRDEASSRQAQKKKLEAQRKLIAFDSNKKGIYKSGILKPRRIWFGTSLSSPPERVEVSVVLYLR
jgi:hypothetical protein